MKNIDRIKQMNSYELAVELEKSTCHFCKYENADNFSNCIGGKDGCINNIRQWLEEEVEE